MKLPLNKKTAHCGWMAAALPCLLAASFAGPAQAASVTPLSPGITAFGPSGNLGTAAFGQLEFVFQFLDDESPVSFNVNMGAGEVINNFDLGIVSRNNATFTPVEDLAIMFSEEAVLQGSTIPNWSSMIGGGFPGFGPTLDSGNFAPDDIRVSIPFPQFTDRVTVQSVNAIGFALSGDDFVITFDPGDVVPVSAVPLPAAVWLFASGIAGAAAVSRRRKKKQS